MKRFKKHLASAILIGTLIHLVIMAIYYFTGGYGEGLDFQWLWQEYYENMIFAIILYMINAYWLQYLLIHYKAKLFTTKLFVTAIIGNVALSLLGVFLSRIIVLVGIRNKGVLEFLANENLQDYKVSMIIAIIVSLLFYAFWFYQHLQENKVKEQKIIAGTASAKFDALKNQLDPHFLFNSLNVLTSLIEEDPKQAQKFTTSLSKVYRYVLEQKDKDLVPVDEELEFARTYVRLLKMRFEDSIVFDIPEQCSEPEAKIVPLSLQLLLENAVKHNVVTQQRPLHISVFEENGSLVVRNNLQEKQVVKKSSGVGLQNIRQRYAILTDKKVHIVKSETEFKIALPILTKRLTMIETQRTYVDDKLYKKAKEHIEAIKAFYGNLFAFCIVLPCLAILNYNTSNFPWVIFPFLGWGLGVVVHAMEVYGYHPILGKQWAERKMRKYMEDDNF